MNNYANTYCPNQNVYKCLYVKHLYLVARTNKKYLKECLMLPKHAIAKKVLYAHIATFYQRARLAALLNGACGAVRSEGRSAS